VIGVIRGKTLNNCLDHSLDRGGGTGILVMPLGLDTKGRIECPGKERGGPVQGKGGSDDSSPNRRRRGRNIERGGWNKPRNRKIRAVIPQSWSKKNREGHQSTEKGKGNCKSSLTQKRGGHKQRENV